MTLPELAIRRHVTALMLLVSLVVLGGIALLRVPLAFEPDIEEPEIFVHLPYPNAAPEQVERMILRPVEDALGSLNGLRSMWSHCGSEGGTVRIELDWSAPVDLARVEVREKLDRIRGDLPEDIGDITVGGHWRSQEADNPILEGRLSSTRDLSESYDLLDRRIVRPLLRVPGVAQVRLDGVSPREVKINLRLADLEAHNVEVRDVRRVVRASNLDQSLGKITDSGTRFAVRSVGSLRSVDEIRDLPLRPDGLRLCDVADVTYEEPEREFGRHLDGQVAVGISVSAESSANVVEVCEALEARIVEMEQDPELEGLQFLVWESQGREIKNTLSTLAYSGVFGAVLAAIVLYLFLRRLSTTLVAVLCIPFSLIVTCGFIWARGGTLNTLSLLGLIVGVGMLVDNAVVVIENIFRHQELGRDRDTAARIGAREVSTAVIAATLTSVIVFLPLVFNQPSDMSLRMREIGVTICIALLASLFVSQTFIPLATTWFIRSRPRPRDRWLLGLEAIYERILAITLRHRWVAVLIGVPVALSALYPLSRVDLNFDRERPEVAVQVHYEFSENLSFEKKEEVVARVERAIEPYRDELLAKSIYSWWSPDFSMTRVYLREGEVTADNLARARDRLREVLPEIPGLRLQVSEPGSSWRRDRGKRVSFQILGEDPQVLADLAQEARERMAAIPGLVNPFADTRTGEHELHVELDRDLSSRHGLSMTRAAETVGLTFRGYRLPRFRTPRGEREMRLVLDERKHTSVAQLANLPVVAEDGSELRLAAVAEFKERLGTRRIERENRRTSVRVGASYREGTREDYLPLVEAALAKMELPPGYSWTFGSWTERRQEMTRGFLVDLGLALLLVFAVMAGLFESAGRAIALLVSLPFAVTGAFWTLYLSHTDFDQPAAVGLILLIGIVVNNGIVMIEHVHCYEREGMPRSAAMLRGCRERLRPILMTALTTLIGLAPVAVQRPSLGGMYYYSMAFVLMGGLALSTFLTALFLPTTATLVEDGLEWARKCVRRMRGRGRRPVLGRRGHWRA
jgi:HAE1 family hydrophobic/amphiphilic exporter-1